MKKRLTTPAGRVLSIVLALALALGTLAAVPQVAYAAGEEIEIDLTNPSGDGVTVSSGTITLSGADKTYKLTGTTTSSVVINANMTVILAGVTIAPTEPDTSGIRVNSGRALTLLLEGTNTVTGTGGGAGVGVPGGATLKIDSTATGTVVGSLTATGGSGGNVGGAGIGGSGAAYDAGGACGTITISGGTVTATGGIGNYVSGTGIGGGGSRLDTGGAGGTVTISGGTVEAYGGGAGIGGAGIGGGASKYGTGGAGGTVTISGGIVTAKSGSGGGGAGIGGGTGVDSTGGAGGTVTISGEAEVTAYSSSGGAGIGGGAGRDTGGDGATVIIGDYAVVTATSRYGAGIGGGMGNTGGDGGDVTISGNATVTASSEYSGAGIGGGSGMLANGGSGGTVVIKDSASVTATGGLNYSGGNNAGAGAGIGGAGGGTDGGAFGALTISTDGTVTISSIGGGGRNINDTGTPGSGGAAIIAGGDVTVLGDAPGLSATYEDGSGVTLYRVQFTVNDGTVPLGGVTVTAGTKTATTNAGGYGTLFLQFGSYTITFAKSDYKPNTMTGVSISANTGLGQVTLIHVPTLTMSPNAATVYISTASDGDTVATATADHFGGIVTYSVSGGALPAGIELNSTSGVVFINSAADLVVTTATPVTIEASDGTDSATCSMTITVEEAPPTVSTGRRMGSTVAPAPLRAPSAPALVVDAARVRAALEEMRSTGAGSARIRHTAKISVLPEAWAALGSTAVDFDTVQGSAVSTRVTLLAPGTLTGERSTSGYVTGPDVDWVHSLFAKWFKNSLRVIHFDQPGDWGQTAHIAAKVDLTGLNAADLRFYSYDKSTNSYRQIKQPAYFIDANGYLHFTTPYAGDIIISEGPLEKK